VFADANEPVLVKGIDTPIVPYTLRGLASGRMQPIPLVQLAPTSSQPDTQPASPPVRSGRK
jgi:hypothetical protein